jgi:catechol 2,3-dioxygenase-like lactoylglutathione lyase family enzyme
MGSVWQQSSRRVAMKLTHVRLLVKNFDACFGFYRDVMGFQALWGEEGSGYANFAVGDGARLALFDRHEMAEAVGTGKLPQEVACQDRAMLIFETEDVGAAVAALGAREAEFVVDAADYPGWGIRAAYMRDPDGTLIELNSPLPRAEWSAELAEKSQRYEQE